MSAALPNKKPTWLFGLLAILGLATVAIPLFLPPPAHLALTVVDKVFASDLRNAPARLTETATGKTVTAKLGSVAGNAALMRMVSGKKRFSLKVDRFEPLTFEVNAPPLSVVPYTAQLVPEFGKLHVVVLDAKKKRNEVATPPRVGLDNGRKQPASGGITFLLDPGSYKVGGEADKYCPGERVARVEKAKTTEVYLPLSPEQQGPERARLILDWEENPRDLDAHLELVRGSQPVDNPQIYYGRPAGKTRGDGGLYAHLDVDWVYSQGFETTTIFDRVDGLYRYFVHRYAGDGTIGGSKATVEVFTKQCQRQMFVAEPSCADDFWHVLDLEIRDGNVSLIPKGRCPPQEPITRLPRELRPEAPPLLDLIYTAFQLLTR